jgi:hypothetical protein
VEDYSDFNAAASKLGNSKITQVLQLSYQVLTNTNQVGQLKSPSIPLKSLATIVKECYIEIKHSFGHDVDLGAVFQCLLMSSIRVLRLPISEILDPASETLSLGQSIKTMFESPAEDFEGGHMESLFRAIALDVIAIENPAGTAGMDIENFSGIKQAS